LNQRNKVKSEDEMSERQAERILEIFENACKNGKEWAHDVVLFRGTEKYQKSIDRLNEAFRLKSIGTIIEPLKGESSIVRKKRR
jgi:hypothetical protein